MQEETDGAPLAATGDNRGAVPWWRQARWRAVAFLAVAAGLNYADRAALSAVLSPLQQDFNLTDAHLGLLGSVFLWCYAIASPVAGVLADRWPRRRVVMLSLLVWSVVTALMGVAPGFLALLLLRGALGLAECLYLPAATPLIAGHHGPDTRGKAMSVHQIGLNFGVVVGGACAGYLADAFNWRAGFLLLGGMGVVLALLSPRFLPPPAAVTVESPRRTADPMEALRYLVRVPSFHVMLCKAVLSGTGIWIFLTWLPLYFKESFHMNLGDAGLTGTFMQQVPVMLGIMAGGIVSDRIARRGVRHRLLAQGVSYLIAAPCLLIFLTAPGFTGVVVAVACFSFFRGLGQASENPTVCELMPARYRSTAVGLMNFFATAAGGAGVLLAGVLKGRFGLDVVFAGIALPFTLCGLGLLLAHRLWGAADTERARLLDAAQPSCP